MAKRNPTKRVRKALAKIADYKSRAKVLRGFDDRFTAANGFDLRSPGSWTAAQRGLVTRRYKNINKIIDDREWHETSMAILKKRTKKLRPFFDETFDPSAGYDLRDVETWNKRKRDKVNNFYRVMAPQLASEQVVKKLYRRPDHLETAIIRSGQEEFLPGQKAAAFGLDKGETLKVDFDTQGQIHFDRDGVEETRLDFNMANLEVDPLAEIERVLKLTRANVFKIQTGPEAKSYDVFTRASIGDAIMARMDAYSKIKPTGQFDAQHYSKWLYGLYAYPDATVKQQQKVSREHRQVMKQKKKDDDAIRRAEQPKYSVKSIKSGRPTKRALLTGRG